jgi:hypothetical protein
VSAEYAIRFLLSYVPGKAEDLALVGSTSTVTAAGLSLIAPVLLPKPVALNQNAANVVAAGHVVVVGVKDQRLMHLAYLALLVLPFAWGWALWMVHRESTDYDVAVFGVDFSVPFMLALAIYLVGMIFTEVKEAV